MMDTDLDQVEASLRAGLGIDAVLAIGAALAALCWGLTQVVAGRPGLALDLAGLDGAQFVVGVWVAATLLLVALTLLAGAPALRYSPLLWFWGLLVGGTLAVDAAALSGAVPPRLALSLLWTPWPVALGVGYLVTGLVAEHRTREAYLIGAVLAGLVLLAAVLFPTTVGDWAFVATGVVHAVPLAIDAATAVGTTTEGAAGYRFRDLGDPASDDGGDRR